MSSVALLSAHVVAFHLKPVAFFAIHPLFSLPYIAPFCFQYINWRTELSSNLANIKADLIKANNSLNVIGTEYWSGIKDNYSYSKKETWVNNVSTVTIPAGTYIFTLKATPCAKGQSYDAFVMGITGINSTRTQNTFYMNFGNGFYPILTSTCIEKVPAGTYGIAFWSSQPRNVNGIELRAIRIK
jgi:hypothetical protein